MKIALIYSHKSNKTSQVAKLINDFSKSKGIDNLDNEEIHPKKLEDYDLLIIGAPTWFDGELPPYWDEMVPALEDLNLKGKDVAIFGNGDQVKYPENFGDAVGLLAEVFESAGAKIVGQTSSDGYSFESSKALRKEKFLGLILDFENQQKKNKERVKNWVKEIGL
ncbi:MAG: flavodoxin [Bacteroidales bacterium]